MNKFWKLLFLWIVPTFLTCKQGPSLSVDNSMKVEKMIEKLEASFLKRVLEPSKQNLDEIIAECNKDNPDIELVRKKWNNCMKPIIVEKQFAIAIAENGIKPEDLSKNKSKLNKSFIPFIEEELKKLEKFIEEDCTKAIDKALLKSAKLLNDGAKQLGQTPCPDVKKISDFDNYYYSINTLVNTTISDVKKLFSDFDVSLFSFDAFNQGNDKVKPDQSRGVFYNYESSSSIKRTLGGFRKFLIENLDKMYKSLKEQSENMIAMSVAAAMKGGEVPPR